MSNGKRYLKLSAPSSRTLSDHVAEQLRRAILTDKLKPGERIVEREIAEAMQISRGPVRDALRLLEHEGLVLRYPHRGTFVARLNQEDAEEIFTLRVALESLAVEYVIKRATAEQIDELEELVDLMQKQIEEGYTQTEAADLDLEFHHTLCQISGHERLLTAWEALGPQIRMLLLSHGRRFPEDWEEQGVTHHRQLVDALRQPDVELARGILHQHLMSSFQGLWQSFEQVRSAINQL